MINIARSKTDSDARMNVEFGLLQILSIGAFVMLANFVFPLLPSCWGR